MVEGSEKITLNNFVAERYNTLRRIGVQCKAANQFEGIDDSIETIFSETKAKHQVCTTIESTLKQSRKDLESVRLVTADVEVDRDISNITSHRIISFTQYIYCSKCMQKILTCSSNDHDRVCFGIPSLHGDEQNEIKDIVCNNIAMLPHTVRNLRLVGVTFDAIKIIWESPIFYGGEALIDYEISYCIESSNLCKRARSKRMFMSCLRWCDRVLRKNNDFILDGLSASTLYTSIRVRCKNKIGWSNYSSAIDFAKTTDPVNPLPPQRFEICRITSTSISFSWTPPFHDGGGDILEYVLTYEEAVPVYKQCLGSKNDKITMKIKSIAIKSKQTSFDLVGLTGNTLIQNMSLKAKNSFGLISELVQCSCDNITTCKSSKEQRVLEEIARVEQTLETQLDSDFFQPGIVQRVERDKYLIKLFSLLEDLKHLEGRDNKKDEDHPISNVNYSIGTSQRVGRFEFRVNALKKEIQNLHIQLEENGMKRNNLIRSLQQAQTRVYALQAELNRFVDYKSEYISSSIVDGVSQEKKVSDFKIEINDELDEKMNLISSWKVDIVLGDKEKVQVEEKKKSKEKQLKEREAAFKSFDKEFKKELMVASRFQGDISRKIIIIWHQFMKHRRQKREAIHKLANQYQKFTLSRCLGTWQKHLIQILLGNQPLSDHNIASSGRGSFLLSKVYVDRQSACDEVKGTIVQLYNCSEEASSCGERKIDLSLLPTHISSDIVRGDYHRNLCEYKHAITFFIKALDNLVNKTISSSVSIMFQCILEEKLAQSYMQANEWNNAKLYLDKLLHHGKAIHNNGFTCSAEICLGDCYLNIGDYESAILTFKSGLSHIRSSESNLLLFSKAYSGLFHCYAWMEDKTRSSHYKNLLKSLHSELREEICMATEKANTLQGRLMNYLLNEGETITFQRASISFVHVTSRKKEIDREIVHARKESAECSKTIKDLHQLVQRIDNEIDRYSTNGKSKQTSSLLHENEQEVDTVELLDRLGTRKRSTNQTINFETKRNSILIMNMKNLQNELVDIQDDLRLERGELMQKVLKSKEVRCMVFNDLNKTGVDVHGWKLRNAQSLIILSMERDIYVYDMIEGYLALVFTGESSTTVNDKHIAGGHSATITCLYFYGDRIYSGALDKTIHCWNVSTGKLEFVAAAHMAAVTCICVNDSKMISGSVDKSVILWDSRTGHMLHRAMGHSHGISSLYCAHSICVSADINGDILVWDFQKDHSSIFRKIRLGGSERSRISVIKCSNVEVISGDANGTITIWWNQNKQILHQRKVHESLITDIQFDATNMVTCSMDGMIKVVDVTTCEVLNTIHGHESPIKAVCYDMNMILSLSTDFTLKQWLWGSRYGSSSNGDVIHTFTDGETFSSICEHYGVTMKDILRWNESRDISNIRSGQKLIVIRGCHYKENNIDPSTRLSSDPFTIGNVSSSRSSRKLFAPLASRLNCYNSSS